MPRWRRSPPLPFCSRPLWGWARTPIPPLTPLMAAIRSSQTPVGWLETRLPPGSAAAFADHSGFTYTLAPAYGLSTRPLGSVVPPPPPPPLPSSTLQVTPSRVNVVGSALVPL